MTQELDAIRELIHKLSSEIGEEQRKFADRRDRLRERYETDLDALYDEHRAITAPMHCQREAITKTLVKIETFKPLTILIRKDNDNND